jgi:hypothetical protein
MILLPEWDCKTCTSRQKELRGCVTEAERPLELDGEQLLRCPRRLALDEPKLLNEVFWFYKNYDRGILPEEGNLLSQPAKLMRMIAIVDEAKMAAQAEQRETEERRAQQRARMQNMLNG